MLRRVVLALTCALPLPCAAADSVCFGSPADGRLERGVRIMESGANFEAYSTLGVALGRTYVHSDVAKTVVGAYASLAVTLPDTRFVYGESGFATGGRIKPHRTHRNGLSVDFMVPVTNDDGDSVPLPSSAFNKFGYDLEFDDAGRHDDLTIDFEAIAAHLHALHAAAAKNGIGLARVIIEPKYIPRLHATTQGAFIRRNIVFMQRQAWIRHDEHYHVDFAVACRPLAG